ncbi:MAG: leucine-rich repeat protein, partial [Oscillospiraceae bacterium]|nr:leucine-rich repeat protein [Oscillospiraceae bacterium]
GCSSLKNVTLPDSVSELGTYAFYNCGALETLTVLNDECKFAAASSVTSAADDLTPTEPFKFDGTILGHTGSTAEAFAKENGCQFKALDEEQPADPEELYKDILDYFRKNIAEEWANYGDVGNATYGIVNNDKTELVSNLWLTTLRNEAYENVGYGFTDINGDGVQELLIGILYNDAEFGKADNAATIIDAYTYWEDKVIHLCSGGARVNYDLGQNGILEDAADGAVVQLTTRYELKDGALVPVECWKNDETNEEMPYAYSDKPVLMDSDGDSYYEFTDWTASTEENRLNNATKSFTIQPFDSKTDLKLGDVNGDSTINASDAALILIAAASIGATNESGLTYAQEQAANINGDNAINASDAAIILQYAASVGANAFTGTLEEYLLAKQAKG